jgi:hypothetical protein
MSFLRVEAIATLTKWREAIIGGAILLGSLSFVSGAVGAQKGFALAGAFIGAALFIEGVRRARFPRDGGGVGVVEVDEHEITFLSPHGGGTVSIDELVHVAVRTNDLGPMASDFFWEFSDAQGQTLVIPGDAENASVLFDALTALPGADYEAVIAASGSTDVGVFEVWKAPPRALH